MSEYTYDLLNKLRDPFHVNDLFYKQEFEDNQE